MDKKPRRGEGGVRAVGALGMVLPVKKSVAAKDDDALEATARVANGIGRVVADRSAIGAIRPLWDVNASASPGRDRGMSPTSVIPMQDFGWATLPQAKHDRPKDFRSKKKAKANKDKGKGNGKDKGKSSRLMEPRGRALSHPAGPLLLEYAREGCPVDIGRPWTR